MLKLPRHAEIWLAPYVVNRVRKRLKNQVEIRRVWVAVADHWEPFWGRPDLSIAAKRVALWCDRWPEIALKIRDSSGNPPKYTFFYPQEEYRREFLELIAQMVRAKLADVEVHIHHNQEGHLDFVSRISSFCKILSEEHGLLRQRNGETIFGFIHGNWALDNSLPGGKWCGLDDEISVLKKLGCYADFTMPSGASPSQSRFLNRIYWCAGRPHCSKSYDSGSPADESEWGAGDLLMIPGPFGLRWRERFVPRLETGELAANDLPSLYRVKRWFDLAPRIGADLFIKLFAHGAKETNSEALLGGGLSDLYALVTEEATRRGAEVRFVSAWEMYSAIMKLCQPRPTCRAEMAHSH
jgi:hypothetical protein